MRKAALIIMLPKLGAETNYIKIFTLVKYGSVVFIFFRSYVFFF